MKNSLFAQERRNLILEMLKRNERVDVLELCEKFDVTGATIRTDLKELEKKGLLKRTHGGAIRLEYDRTLEDTPLEREITEEKRKIARKAIELIEDNDVIGIDTGTTCTTFAEELIQSNKKNLSILTYDLRIALVVSENTSYNVQVLGGLLRNKYPYAFGGSVLSEISKFSIDKAFIATNAFDIEFGFSTPNYETAEIKKSLIDIAKKKIFLCDSPKINKRCFCSFANLENCDCLVVDDGIEQREIDSLSKKKVNIKIAT